jgi:SAM-dependent methyltransferase
VARKPHAQHRETEAAWDLVARVKYRHEFDEHVAVLRSGRHNLLPAEAEELQDLLPGAHVVHLQCSHGFDTIGLLNAGAASVVGVDISSEMIDQARRTAAEVGADAASFLCGDVIDVPDELAGTADLVYTGRGSLPWILDLAAWAGTVRAVLKHGGHIFLFEGHPLTALWNRETSALELRKGASYFDEHPTELPGFPAAIVRRESGDTGPRMLERYWRPGEVMDALIARGLTIRRYGEYPTVFWDQFPEWSDELRSRLPNSYAILARL